MLGELDLAEQGDDGHHQARSRQRGHQRGIARRIRRVRGKRGSHLGRLLTGVVREGRLEDAGTCEAVGVGHDAPAYAGPMADVSWMALALALSVCGALWTWYAWRNRGTGRSEEHTSELQSLMRISYA